MVESYFRVRFITDQSAVEAYKGVLSLLETKEERPDYNEQGDYYSSINGKSVYPGLQVDDSEMHILEYDGAVLSLDVDCASVVSDKDAGPQQLNETFDIVRQLYQGIDALYVFGMHSERIETIGLPESLNGISSPISDESLAQNRIVAPTWLMLFPPAMVEEYGREWLLDLPAERIDELDDGAIMIVATTDIFDAEDDLEIANAVGKGLRPLEDAFAERQ